MRLSLHRQTARMATHTVHVEVPSADGSSWVPLPAGTAIRPNIPLRLEANGAALPFDPILFRVTDSVGVVVHEDSDLTDALGNAAVELSSPVKEDLYTVVATARSFPFLPITHDRVTTFRVLTNAEPPAPPPEPTPVVDQLRALLIVVAVIAGVVVVGGAARDFIRR